MNFGIWLIKGISGGVGVKVLMMSSLGTSGTVCEVDGFDFVGFD